MAALRALNTLAIRKCHLFTRDRVDGGEAPVFNARYLDFARHYAFSIAPCGVGKGNEKGRVENGVGYVKKNLLNGLELPDFSAMNPAARVWLDTVANVRLHGETHQKPLELFKEEQTHLKPLPALPYDIATIKTVRASKQFRIALETNRYLVPSEYASARVTLKTYPDRLCMYHQEKLIARHARSYDRYQDIEDPDHPRALLEQRRNAREQKLLMRFLTLSPKAQTNYEELQQRRLNPRHHLRKIVASVPCGASLPICKSGSGSRANPIPYNPKKYLR